MDRPQVGLAVILPVRPGKRTPGGHLLITEYLGRSTGVPEIGVDEQLRRWGFELEEVKSAQLAHDPQAQTYVVAIKKPASRPAE
jgi:hypothetical protein